MENYSATTGKANIGRRRHSRLRLCLPARLVTLSGNFTATLVDLSRTGARIAVERAPAAGSEAILEWGNFDAFCAIVRFDGVCCALIFEQALSQDVVLAARQLSEEAPELNNSRAYAKAWASGTLR